MSILILTEKDRLEPFKGNIKVNASMFRSEYGLLKPNLYSAVIFTSNDRNIILKSKDHVDTSRILKDAYNNDIKYRKQKKYVGIIKEVCKEFNMSYRQLAIEIGVSESSIRSTVSVKKISLQMFRAIEIFRSLRLLEDFNSKRNH